MPKNVIVMMFDTLQFNYIGCYGNTWIKTPNMDRLAREGVVFENAYSEGLPTIPVRRAMHTGRYTLPVAGWVPLSAEDTTIADLCWGRAIDTTLIFDAPPYRLPKFGYTRGFDNVMFTHGHEGDDYFYEKDPLYHYQAEDFMEEDAYAAYGRRYNSPKVAEAARTEVVNFLRERQNGIGNTEETRYVTMTMNKAIDYLKQVDRNHQFFLWIDSFDPHEPWDPPSVYDSDKKCPYDPDYTGKDDFMPVPELVEGIYTEEQMNHVRMLYAELVTLCDKNLGRLMQTIRELGLEEDTMLLLVSDHGSPMGNGEHGHGLMRKMRPWPYEELVHIPVILRAPGIKAGQRITSFVQSVDVAPTVCEWLGIKKHPDMQGESLLPLARGEVDKVRDFAIAGYHGYSWSIITPEWSYIHWLKPDEDGRLMRSSFYRKGVDSSHLKAVGGKAGFMPELTKLVNDTIGSEQEKRYRENASTDGADQWTCTPGSSTGVPEKDELYHRSTDPFQLNNVLEQYPDVAKELFDKLREHISELRAS